MRYHVVVYQVPDIHSDEQIAFIDQEFDFAESSHKITDVIHGAIDQLVAEGGQG
jgi:hypothetical protein